MEYIFKNQLITSAVAVAAGLALSGCSSSSGGSSVNSPDGIYSGTTTGGRGNPPGGNEKGVIYNNRLMVFSDVFDIQQLINAPLTVTDNSVTGVLEFYSNKVVPILGTADLSGTFVAGVSASFSYINAPTSFFNDGTISLTADTASYTKGSSLVTVTGSWQGVHGGSGNASTLSVDAAGSVAGSDTEGCNFTGSIIPADTSVNVYNATIVSSGGVSCVSLPISTYTGFAWSEGVGDTTLNLTVSDGTYSRSVVLTKN